jgi:ribonuclease P protein component
MQRHERFTKAERLLKRREYRHVYDQGQRHHFPLFTIFVLKNAQPTSRLGVTVTKRIGSAVVRNRCKRLVRESFRRHTWRLTSPVDIVVNVKQPMAQATYQQVERQFLELIGKLGTEHRVSD